MAARPNPEDVTICFASSATLFLHGEFLFPFPENDKTKYAGVPPKRGPLELALLTGMTTAFYFKHSTNKSFLTWGFFFCVCVTQNVNAVKKPEQGSAGLY